MKNGIAFGAGCALLALSASGAAAGSGCSGDCYEKVTRPPVYETVTDLYVARDAQVVRRRIPATVERVSEPVVLRPARTVAKVVPAVYGTERESYLISPARREWQVTVDGYGRKIGCWVEVPAVYGTRHRRVVVQEEQVTYVTIPEKVGIMTRDVVTSPAKVVREYTPPVYETRQRSVQVAPATSEWVPVGPGAARAVETTPVAYGGGEVLMPRRGGVVRTSGGSAWWNQ